MDYDGERRKSRRLFYIYFIDDTACSATPEWSDGMLPMPHSLLSFTNQTNLKKDRNAATFPNDCLENRKIRINTHTHTQGLARQGIIKHLIIKGLQRIILSGYPRDPIIIHQKYTVPPCFPEQGGTELLSGGIRPAGFPCPSAAVFFRAAFRQRSRHPLNLK